MDNKEAQYIDKAIVTAIDEDSLFQHQTTAQETAESSKEINNDNQMSNQIMLESSYELVLDKLTSRKPKNKK